MKSLFGHAEGKRRRKMGKEEKTERMATTERRQEEGKRDCDRRRQF